jgi:hypothetical protein
LTLFVLIVAVEVVKLLGLVATFELVIIVLGTILVLGLPLAVAGAQAAHHGPFVEHVALATHAVGPV